MELLNGRPSDCRNRLEREVRTYDLLDELGIHYQRTDHRATDTMAECNEIDAQSHFEKFEQLFLHVIFSLPYHP